MKTTALPGLRKFATGISLLMITAYANAAPTTNGNVIEVPDDGWYQIQSADNYESICEGVLRCEVIPGDYIVINHTTGERFNVTVSGGTTTDSVSVSGNLIQWPNDGWYQIQDASTYASICEGGRSCDVPNGEYIVINHTTGNRQTVSVGQTESNTFATVVGNTISWPDNGWYQVQNATTFESLCEGERSCTVSNGNYIVVNHTTGERDDNVVVNSDSTIVSPSITPPVFDLVEPQVMPAQCIGSVDKNNTRFCVNPQTRLFSATLEDGSVQWSYTLPGANETNQIETVLTTDQWLIIVADRFPEKDTFTLDERANQYEASLFNKYGGFVRTVPLKIQVRVNNPDETGYVNSRLTSGVLNDPLSAIATESDSGNPLLVIGWNRWRVVGSRADAWDFGGVSVFDLASSTRLRSLLYSEDGISNVSLLKGDRDIIRVVSGKAVVWLYIDTLQFVHPSYFSQFVKDATIRAYGSVDSQLNGGNYREVISRVLPWINGDIHNEMIFGSVTDQPPRSFSIPFSDFALLSESRNEDYYNNKFYQCSNGGELLNQDNAGILITNVFDHCAFGDKTYKGKLAGNYAGREGFVVRGENLTVHRHNSSLVAANLGYHVSRSRVLNGSTNTYFGSMAGFGESETGKNISVANYTSIAEFRYGRDIGNGPCGDQFDSNGQPSVYCTRYFASGSVRGQMTLNADWTSYSSILVNGRLGFGQDYLTDFILVSTGETPDPIPYDGPTEPLKEFYFGSGGTITITSQDQSRIEINATGEVSEPTAFTVKVFDPQGNELGNFPMEFLNVKCAERLDSCTVPQ